MARQLRVEPVTRYQLQGRRRATRDLLARRPAGAHPLGVGGYKACSVGHGAVGDDLDDGPFGGLQATAEVLGDHHDAADVAGREFTLERRDVAVPGHVEPPRVLVGLRQAQRRRAGILQREPYPGACRVQRDRIAEQEQHDQRQYEGDQECRRSAQDLQRFFEEHRAKPPCADEPAHAASLSRSDSSMSAMKASSRVGSLRSVLRVTRAFNSSGVPVAICVAR